MKNIILLGLLGLSVAGCAPRYEYETIVVPEKRSARTTQCPTETVMLLFAPLSTKTVCPPEENIQSSMRYICDSVFSDYVKTNGHFYTKEDVLGMKNQGWTIESEEPLINSSNYVIAPNTAIDVECVGTRYILEKEISAWDDFTEKLKPK